MNNRKEMIDFALAQMSGFTLEDSSGGDNRSIFSLVKMLIQSASGETLTECRKPLVSVINMKTRNPKDKFHGCKLTLLQQTIGTLFGSNDLLSDGEFAGYDRDKLLEYLELCRKIFIAKYVKAAPSLAKTLNNVEPKFETAMARALRQAEERSVRKGSL
jgi:hypothetical protein